MEINKIIFCMSIVLLISLVSAEDVCEICIEGDSDPAMCPPECFGMGDETDEGGNFDGPVCGDGELSEVEDCERDGDCSGGGKCIDCICVVNESIESICTENWQCSEWSDCEGNGQERVCNDLSDCEIIGNKPEEVRGCIIESIENMSENVFEENISSNISGNIFEGNISSNILGEDSKKQKGFLIYLVIVVVIILIMVVSYFLFKKSRQRDMQDSLTVLSTES